MLELLLLGVAVTPRTSIPTGRAGGLTGITVLIAIMIDIALTGGGSRSGHGTDTLENTLNVLNSSLPLSAVSFEFIFLLLEGGDLFFAPMERIDVRRGVGGEGCGMGGLG